MTVLSCAGAETGQTIAHFRHTFQSLSVAWSQPFGGYLRRP